MSGSAEQEPATDDGVVAELIRAIVADREQGMLRTPDDYRRAFPGFAAALDVALARVGAPRTPAQVHGEEAHTRSAMVDAVRYGPYLLVERLGAGGFGEVFRAEDPRLGRSVALKILRRTGPTNARALERFRREARILARLDVPGVAPVFDVGEVDGNPYLALRYVPGRSLAKVMAERGRAPLDPETFLLWIEKVAHALHRAHEAGVVHRDVKPANIIIDPNGEPVVVDFGIALDQSLDDSDVTQSGDITGSPAYMSPEQLLGKRVPVDRRTDVWSLGVVLYEGLAGVRPFDAPTRAGLFQQIATKEPIRLRTLNHALSRDHEAVIETALSKDCDRRYQAAADLADEVARLRRGEPVRARPLGAIGRFRSWSRGNPGLAAACLGLALSLLGGVVGTSMLAISQSRTSDLLRLAIRMADVIATAELQFRNLPPAREAARPQFVNFRDRLLSLRRDSGAVASLRAACPEVDGFVAWAIDPLESLFRGYGLASPGTGVEFMLARLDAAMQATAHASDAWRNASKEIAASPIYGGLSIRPQFGLIPLGANPDTGLWEFLCAFSAVGTVPSRAPNGQLLVDGNSGLVFVLLPAGSWSPRGQAGRAPLGPVVALDPFFVSKFELTQLQWTRLGGRNRSAFQSGQVVLGDEPQIVSDRLPLENVTWEEARFVLSRYGYALPTEPQWEYAARGGMNDDTRWFFGDDESQLSQFANIWDTTARRRSAELQPGEPDSGPVPAPWSDSYLVTAPVGSLRPNGFGLYDVYGNVAEFCADAAVEKQWPRRAGDGSLIDPDSDGQHRNSAARPSDERTPSEIVFKGAGWLGAVEKTMTHDRTPTGRSNANRAIGIRPIRRLEE